MASTRRLTSLPTLISNVAADVADLVEKEFQLVRAELSYKIASRLRGGYWMIVAAVFGLLAIATTCQAAVVWIMTFGVVAHIACLIVALFLLALAAFAYLLGRSAVREDLTPSRSIHQIKEDIRTTKEQFT